MSAVAELLPVETEVIILRYGMNQKNPYIGCTGRVVGHNAEKGLMRIILDQDPVPGWRNIGVFCYIHEVQALL